MVSFRASLPSLPGARYSTTTVSDLLRHFSLPSSQVTTRRTVMSTIQTILILETQTLAKKIIKLQLSGMDSQITILTSVSSMFIETETPGLSAGGIPQMKVFLVSGESLMLLTNKFATPLKQISMLRAPSLLLLSAPSLLI